MTALLDHFHEAVTMPEDVDKLKKLILQLAMQGKLVEQDTNDEPVKELLKKIEAKKEQLLIEKKIRKPQALPPIKEGEIPYQLPNGWEWVRLGSIGQIVGGGTPKTDVDEFWSSPGEGIPWVTPADLGGKSDVTISRGRRDVSPLGLEKSSAVLMPSGTVLFSSRAPIGYVAIAENEISTNQGFKSVVPYIIEMNYFIFNYLLFLGDKINENASGTTFKEVSGKKMSVQLFPIAPIEEQKRIVEKIDNLFKQCDQLYSELVKKQTKSALLNKSVFSRLQDHNNHEQMNDLRFVVGNMAHLCNDKDSIDQLRNSVLSLAVQGKLVEQNSKDEPASLLVEKIILEKNQLMDRLHLVGQKN